jgi:hypothetical protein
MKWNSLLQNYQGMGGLSEARAPWKIVNYVASDPELKNVFPTPSSVFRQRLGDDLETRKESSSSRPKAFSDENQGDVSHNEIDFFDDSIKNTEIHCPEVKPGFGNEWELLYASLDVVSAMLTIFGKNARCEALATVVTMVERIFGGATFRQQAFINLGLSPNIPDGDGPVPRKDREVWQRRPPLKKVLRLCRFSSSEKPPIAIGRFDPARTRE